MMLQMRMPTLVNFVNPCGRHREGRQWQPNYRGDDKYKLKIVLWHVAHFESKKGGGGGGGLNNRLGVRRRSPRGTVRYI